MASFEKKGVSLYLLISENIQEKITSEQWPEGTKLPSEPELAKDFQVSRFTIRQAISELVDRGYLIRERGRGTFVSKPSFEGNFVKSFFPGDLGSLHKFLSLREVMATSFLEKRLAIPKGTLVTELYRARYILDDKIPSIIEKTYFKSTLLPEIEKMDMSSRLFSYIINNYGIPLLKAKSVIEAVLPEKNEADILMCSLSQPLLMMTRICYTTGDKPVVLTKSLIRTDKCKLSMEDTM
jgi:GntR family transcriptional regulator